MTIEKTYIFQILFSDNFLKNPPFIFDLEDPDPRDREPECSAIVSLAQKPKDRKEARPIGFRVYKVSLKAFHMTPDHSIQYHLGGGWELQRHREEREVQQPSCKDGSVHQHAGGEPEDECSAWKVCHHRLHLPSSGRRRVLAQALPHPRLGIK